MLGDRLHNRVDRVSGKAKEWTGRATGNTRREREGRIQAGLAYA
jgi:uncharacterized protein YjbJ (UPF0337 family)